MKLRSVILVAALGASVAMPMAFADGGHGQEAPVAASKVVVGVSGMT